MALRTRVGHTLRWGGLVATVGSAAVLATLESGDWLTSGNIRHQPGYMHFDTGALSADAGDFVRYFMVGALPWSAVVALTSISVGVRGPSIRLVAFLLPLLGGMVLLADAGDKTGWRLEYVDDARDRALVQDSATVAYAATGFLALAALLLLCRLHVVYSAMLVVAYTGIAAYHLAGAAALERQFGGAGQVHVTSAPRDYAVAATVAAVSAAVATVGSALLPKLRPEKKLLIVRFFLRTGRLTREFVESLRIGLTPVRQVPGYESRPHFRVLLLAGLVGMLMGGVAVVLAFALRHPVPDPPRTSSQPAGAAQLTGVAR
ncbi:hypothetical protein Val02_89420 [Virgisporangium aliadipatigenens]|uniref:Uncharacterized protein n=1 Tax=Virgisporangium aliadipatigenens TaxID=741659 RepID=A0A8J3YYI7_9ACTN|nr:hypothetical protein [Virgisporangium aliadipatigenens]GIJ52056.1 hypothetical protein Val02_89420 [Virgisporangium aliadipatigenens]